MLKIIFQHQKTHKVLKTFALSFVPPVGTIVTFEEGSKWVVSGHALTFVPAKTELLLSCDEDETGFGEPPVVVLLRELDEDRFV